MDKQKFDALTRAFATGSSRRTAIKGIFGGAVGVAVATTRLDRGGAQVSAAECAPETVGEDCPLPDACTTAACLDSTCVYSSGCEDCDVCDTLSGTCVDQCGACENCGSGGTCFSTCSGCESCVGGQCVSYCTDCQKCEGGVCVDLSDGVCCGGTWIGGGQCCDAFDCTAPVADFCSSVACLDNICTNVPECPDDQQCCGLGSEGAYCADCCDNDDCYIAGPCSVCEQGFCTTPTCCYDTDCPDCQVCGFNGECAFFLCEPGYSCCGGHDCIPEDECCGAPGDFCGLLEVTGADGSSQNDCCDGYVCCDNWGDMGPICAQCCNDWDCGKDGWCNRGWCEYPTYCDHDKDCPKGTCCCKDGSCSGKCCDTPHPPKPPKPPKPHKPYTPAPPASGGTVSTLPATGAGPNDERNNLLGVTALGAAAALLAAKKLRETPEA